MRKFIEKIKIYLKPFANLKFLISFGVAWFITNGWCYVGIALGTAFGINWLLAVSSAYFAFLWLPFTPEKIVTVALAILFQTIFFPKDLKLRQDLENLKIEARKDWDSVKRKISRLFRKKEKTM